MADKLDVAQLQNDLVDAFEWGEEERATAVVSQLAAQPRQARVMLDEMLASPDASVRRAAVFGLGELGGAASLKRLEQQMASEEARDGHDGASVLEVITQTLGRIKEADARASLIRRLKRLLTGKVSSSGLDDVTYALWRKRHPELIPVIRSALEQLPPENSLRLRALLRLLETPPEALAAWALDASAPLKDKTKVFTLLDEELPDELLTVLPVFISVATALGDMVVSQQSDAPHYCERLFTTLLLHWDQVLPALPAESRSGLRVLARRCVAANLPRCSLRAARILKLVGHREDAPLIEAHRPADAGLAKVYDDAAQTLRNLPSM